MQHWILLEGYLGVAWPWSSHLKNIIYTEFILFKAYLPPQSSSIHPSAIFAKVAPLLPAACGPGCEFLLLVWAGAAKLLADLLPPRGRTLISWWRSLLGETCAGCRPVHPGPRFTTGPRAGPGRRVYLTPIHPWHSTTQGLALTTAPQQQQLSWRTTTVREEQDWSDQIVRTAWWRCWQTRHSVVIWGSLTMLWWSAWPGSPPGLRGQCSHVGHVSAALEVSIACVSSSWQSGTAM